MRIVITGAIFCICFFMPQQLTAAKLTINISNQEKSGVLFLTICNSAAGFENSVENESEEESCITSAEEIDLQNFQINSMLPRGEYAISLFVDSNGNKKLDKNFFGIPKEQYGFSNNVMGRMSPPTFDQAKFMIEGPTTQNIKLRIGIPKKD